MNAEKVDMYLMMNAKNFDSMLIPQIRERLLAVPDEKWMLIQTLQLKDPTLSLIVSLLVGSLGIDRFMIGDIGMGVGKLITCGGLGIWAIVDWFMIQDATRQKNALILQHYLMSI